MVAVEIIGKVDALAEKSERENKQLRDTISRQRMALNQASFCIRSLTPDDPDAKFTVEIINRALTASAGA